MSTCPIDWSLDLSVGDSQMDHDHRLFIYTLNSLYCTIDGGGDFMVIEALLCRLVDVSAAHFVREERLMGRTRFPLRAGHVAEHSRLLHVLGTMILSYENRDLATVRATADAFRDIFLLHVTTFDQRLRQHLAETGRARLQDGSRPLAELEGTADEEK